MQSKCNSYSSDYSLHESVGMGFQVYNLVRTFLKVDPERYISSINCCFLGKGYYKEVSDVKSVLSRQLDGPICELQHRCSI